MNLLQNTLSQIQNFSDQRLSIAFLLGDNPLASNMESTKKKLHSSHKILLYSHQCNEKNTLSQARSLSCTVAENKQNAEEHTHRHAF